MNTTQHQHDGQKCLACGTETQQKSIKRGLCVACYEKFRRARDRFPREEWPSVEARMISKGVLAPDGRANDNIFEQIANEIRKLAVNKVSDDEEPALIQPVGKPKKRAVKKPAVESSVKRKKA